MSIKAMNWVWECSKTVGTDRLVLLAIADRAGDEGMDAWPSVPTLAHKTRLHERTVQRCIRNIEALGELEVKAKEGTHGVNVYVVRMDALSLQPSSRPKRRAPRQRATGGKLPPGGSSATGPPAQAPPPGGRSATGVVAQAPPDPSSTSSTSSTPVVSPSDAASERREADNIAVRQFIGWFCDAYKQHRKGARYHVQAAKDVPTVRRLLGEYGDAALREMTALLLTERRDEFIAKGDRGIGVLSVKASWLSNRLAERQRADDDRWICPHVDPCGDRGQCRTMTLLGRPTMEASA